jgi:molybdate-binding protein/DNA-binding XRE family transcriptional regulator
MSNPPDAEETPSVLAAKRRQKNLTQSELARMCGISRQFLCMIESGHTPPNVKVALRLAGILDCTVEDLFAQTQDSAIEDVAVTCARKMKVGARVNVAKVGESWVAHPADTQDSIGGGFTVADGILSHAGTKASASCWQSLRELEGNLLFAGCDPAMQLLCSASLNAPGHSTWINCGSGVALQYLSEGLVHVAGLHYGFDDGDANLRAVKKAIPGDKIFIMRFSSFEQGWILGSRVKDNFHGMEDVVKDKLRIANRESGAAVREWLDGEMKRLGVGHDEVSGYDIDHYSHTEAVESLQAGRADVMLGPCVIASVFGLRFVPIGRVAFDLAFPKTLFDHPRMVACLKWLGSKRFVQELTSLPSYEIH